MDAYRNSNEYAGLSGIGIVRGSVARIEKGRGMRLRVETGAAWVTQERCPDDVALTAGESHCIDRDGLTLISTCGGVRFALVTIKPSLPVAPTLAERIWNVWARLYVMPSRAAMVGL